MACTSSVGVHCAVENTQRSWTSSLPQRLPPNPTFLIFQTRFSSITLNKCRVHTYPSYGNFRANVRATTGEGISSQTTSTDAYKVLDDVVATKDADALRSALDKLQEQGKTKLWSSTSSISRRNTFMTELTRLGIKNPEQLASPSVRNDAVFLVTVVGVTSAIAVAAGQLPGDWGFFVPYLVGSISLVVLAVGSVAPGLFQVVSDKFSTLLPEHQERVLRHEAAHFLIAYMVGLPILGYSLDLGKEHVNLGNESVEKKIYEGLDANLLDRLAVVSMAGNHYRPI